jgi:hypothetical protein
VLLVLVETIKNVTVHLFAVIKMSAEYEQLFMCFAEDASIFIVDQSYRTSSLSPDHDGHVQISVCGYQFFSIKDHL